jgi:4-hydroxybenzoate polyprenyltransferase
MAITSIPEPPLCVDLDGALLLSDSPLETFCQLLKQSPETLLRLPFWLARGRTYFQSQLAQRCQPAVENWPLDAEVVSFLEEEKRRGRTLVLVTTADRRVAAAIQDRLRLFDEFLSREDSPGLSGQAKADALGQRFGAKKFDYLGSSSKDLPVWQQAKTAYVAGGQAGVADRVAKAAKVERIFARPRATIIDWMRAIRMHQWIKNLLLLLPLLGAHQWTDASLWSRILPAMAAFSLCASSVYLLNDLLDLGADRQHPYKRYRPLASGKVSLLAGLIAAPVLLGLAVLLALTLGRNFALIFGLYYLLTLLYSLRLKQVELLDVLLLAGLYGIRIIAGGVAVSVQVTDWLLMFSMFVFLSLAFVKRHTELYHLGGQPDAKVKGRAYVNSDIELVSTMGVGTGYLSILVLAMYVSHPDVTALYHQPRLLWLACPVLFYWISRVWLLTHRGAMHADPILFALRDRQSWLVMALLALIGFIAGPK